MHNLNVKKQKKQDISELQLLLIEMGFFSELKKMKMKFNPKTFSIFSIFIALSRSCLFPMMAIPDIIFVSALVETILKVAVQIMNFSIKVALIILFISIFYSFWLVLYLNAVYNYYVV